MPDCKLFASLPGAGAALAPQLLAAFGENRDRFPDAASVQKCTGIAPVVERSGWAKAFYESRRAKGASHQAILRALAFKWIRILWRCWHDRQPYDEARYLMALLKRHSPILANAAQSA